MRSKTGGIVLSLRVWNPISVCIRRVSSSFLGDMKSWSSGRPKAEKRKAELGTSFQILICMTLEE